MNKTLQDLMSRKSIRSFKEEQIAEEDLQIIINAGKAAPSSLNRQPWHFTVIQDSSLLDSMVEDNKRIVLASPELIKINGWINVPNYHNFYHAPTVILISGDKENYWHVCDCALAMENMSLAAWSISIGSCIIASTRFIFNSDKGSEYANKLGIPKGYTPLYMLALGYKTGEDAKPTPRKDGCVNYIR